jgi:DNA-binding MarR family transcriptional regulator
MIRGIEGKRIFRDTLGREDFVTRILAWSLLGWVRAKITWILSREYGIAMADIAKKLGVCTSAIAKAIRKKEGED